MADADSRPKKRVIKANPREVAAIAAAAPARDINENLICPIGKSEVFANIPAITLRSSGEALPAGPVYLRYGRHFSANKGFGFQHIWTEHYPYIVDHDAAMERIRNELAAVLRPGTEIFHDSERVKKGALTKQSDSKRLNVQRLHLGIVIVALMPGAHPHYSIITGGYNPGYTKGSLVGALV